MQKSMSDTVNPPVDGPKHGPTLLYVEDDAATVEIFKTIWLYQMKRPVRLITAYDRQSAIATIKRSSCLVNAPYPHMILSDLNLPGMNGFALVREFREMPECRGVPIVFFSSSTVESERRTALALGALAFFHKPMKFDECRAAVDHVYSLLVRAVGDPRKFKSAVVIGDGP
jgi:CheY-like chemotaxis protein